ncbi:hypothetical protein K2173_023252 [Erythroxylum novogranatense]|uniref:Uncharacterized protein n=1 Tax=Erythroxylum novogranatense TaxID=1862640 RepID=A0AAV8T8C4_9ROSI|nr:hypothetical protein K2173_023252 [Erythroxylum novogranatense]
MQSTPNNMQNKQRMDSGSRFASLALNIESNFSAKDHKDIPIEDTLAKKKSLLASNRSRGPYRQNEATTSTKGWAPMPPLNNGTIISQPNVIPNTRASSVNISQAHLEAATATSFGMAMQGLEFLVRTTTLDPRKHIFIVISEPTDQFLKNEATVVEADPPQQP